MAARIRVTNKPKKKTLRVAALEHDQLSKAGEEQLAQMSKDGSRTLHRGRAVPTITKKQLRGK